MLAPRDKLLLALLAVAGALAIGIAFATHSSHSDARCVVVHFPSTVGGGTLRRCGPAARALCRTGVTELHMEDAIAAACRRSGYEP